MQVDVTVGSGKNLKNVNWRNGDLKPYAVLWIDSGPKCTTRVDNENDEDPKWDEKLTIIMPPTSRPEAAILYIDVVHANALHGTKPLVGSAQLPLRDVLNEARTSGKVPRKLKLKRPSGRPHGKLEINIGLKDQTQGMGPYGQPGYYGYAPPPQPAPPAYQYPYGAPPPAGYPVNTSAKPAKSGPSGYGYGPPPVQAYGGAYGPAPVKQKKDKGPGLGTGLAVGAAAGLLGGLVIAEGLEALENNNHPQVVVENVQYVNETNVYETNNTYESTNVYNDGGYDDGGYDDGSYDDGGW